MFIHDEEKAGIWLIDFGKTVPLPEGMTINHNSAWEVGNHEDGYLIGIDNLIELFKSLVHVLKIDEASEATVDHKPDVVELNSRTAQSANVAAEVKSPQDPEKGK